MRRCGVIPGLYVAMLTAAHAQTPAFDIASLKPVRATGDVYRANLGRTLHGEVRLSNVTLSDCLRFAYSITNDAQIQGPDWIRSKEVRFDITARAAPDTPVSQLLVMLRTLLTERFHLVLRREEKELPFLALTIGKKGSQLREATDSADSPSKTSILGKIVSDRMTVQVLATLLSRFLRETVIDMTGLKGWYEVNLQWAPERLHATAPGSETGEAASGPSIYTAVQEQLGLRLESRKGPLEVLVVDRGDRVPAEN